MIRPCLRFIMCGAAARVTRNVLLRFRRSTKSKSAATISQILAFREPPRLLTKTPMRPCLALALSIRRVAPASSVRSPVNRLGLAGNSGGHASECVAFDVAEHDGGAFGRKTLRNRAGDTVRRSGHNRDLTL